MPRAYFEPESLDALAEVFAEAKRRLNCQDINDPTQLDFIAQRILNLAADGLPPWMILREIAPQVDAKASIIKREDADEHSGKEASQSTR